VRYRQTIDEIIAATCIVTGVARDDLLSDRRSKTTVYARQLAGYVSRLRKYSYSEIGRALGRDHSTIVIAVQKLEEQRTAKKDKGLAVDIRRVNQLAASYAAQRVAA
jgi:chromosomal replication initiation ATPase DnaA